MVLLRLLFLVGQEIDSALRAPSRSAAGGSLFGRAFRQRERIQQATELTKAEADLARSQAEKLMAEQQMHAAQAELDAIQQAAKPSPVDATSRRGIGLTGREIAELLNLMDERVPPDARTELMTLVTARLEEKH